MARHRRPDHARRDGGHPPRPLASLAARTTEPALTEQTITTATRPLADAGWTQSIHGPFIRWAAPQGAATGVQFDAFAAQARNGTNDKTWTIWGGNHADQPVWAVHLSPRQAPAQVLHELPANSPKANAGPLGQTGSDRWRARPPAPVSTASPAFAVTPPAPAHVPAGPHHQGR